MKTRVTRYCSVCLSFYNKLIRASYVASGLQGNDIINWNECSNHEPMQNHLNIFRRQRIPFEQWFREHGFRYNPITGAAEFRLSDHPGKFIEVKPCRSTFVKPQSPLVAALLRRPAGMGRR